MAMESPALKKITDAFDRHKGKSDVSIDQHVRKCQIELAQSLQTRHAIYLDVKYWIILCEAFLCRSKSPPDQELLNEITKLADKGQIFCPISESIFVELMKQRDMKTRLATAQLIDRLSLGVSLIPFFIRTSTEIAHMLHSYYKPGSTYPLQWLVWSKLSYVMGPVHPSNTVFDAETELLMQKAFFDRMWNISLEEMINTIGEAPVPPLDAFDSLASKLNIGNAEHANELRSYEQTYLNEISGAIDVHLGAAAAILEDMARIHGDKEKAKVQPEILRNLIMEVYRRGEIHKIVPTLDIYAHCHASVRWNKGQQLEPNSFFDFHHASAALAYCEAFFTERTLCALLTQNSISLDRKYDCRVCHKVNDAIEYLNTVSG